MELAQIYRLINYTAECQQKKLDQKSEEDIIAIDFFSVRLQCTYENVIQRLSDLPVLSIIEHRDAIMKQGIGDCHFSHIVEFCGVPWGMNTDFTLNDDDVISIHDLKFIPLKQMMILLAGTLQN